MTSLDTAQSAAGGAISFTGNRRAYWRLLIRGALLLMVTLGIYRFWLATDVRRYLWANTQVDGEALEYTGSALELLIGFLVAVAILIPVYAALFLAALGPGTIGELSGILAFLALGLLGQYAVYRARRYRLTRTVYRGLRFHQEGAAWNYAVRACLWWLLSVLTLGLAYPFQCAIAAGTLQDAPHVLRRSGRFEGSGLRLFARGLPMWIAVIAPLAITIAAFFAAVDWDVLDAAFELSGDAIWKHIKDGNPDLVAVIGLAMFMAGLSVTLAALLYPAFQALSLRWWSSGLRFGEIAMHSTLRTRQVYGTYLRFLWYVLLFSIAASIIAIPATVAAFWLLGGDNTSTGQEIVATAMLLVSYVIAALALSTIYRATVLLSLWRLGMESLQLSGLSALERVKASGDLSSPLGEGLADALHVGGI